MGSTERQKMRGVRRPAVAGLFYPGDPSPLRRMVDEMFLEADGGLEPVVPKPVVPKAVIAPHAGYPYSGPIAANAFEPLRPLAGRIERVVVIGPSHHVAFRGLALPAAESFESPLGRLEIDLEAAEDLLELPYVRVDDAPHQREHALEVELPFLQQVLGNVRIVPLVAGSLPPHQVAEALARVWGGEETRIVVSSDLSHFLDYEAARRVDRRTADAILRLEVPLDARQACGAVAINGLLHLAAAASPLAPRLLDLRSSGDTAGDRRRVVGYGAFSFAPN